MIQDSDARFMFEKSGLDIIAGISVGIYATLGMTRSTPSSGFGFRFSI